MIVMISLTIHFGINHVLIKIKPKTMISIIKLLKSRMSKVHWSFVIYFFPWWVSRLKSEYQVMILFWLTVITEACSAVHIDYNDILNLVPIFYLPEPSLSLSNMKYFYFFSGNNCQAQDKYQENKIQETGPDTRLILLTPQPTRMVSLRFWSAQSCYFLLNLTPNWLNKNCKN